jgi:hypothetical protein
VEKGLGLITAMYQINEYREEDNLSEVGLSTFRLTMKRLGPAIRKVRRRKKGNRDPTYPWMKARQIWVTQLLVRLGKHTFDCTAKENEFLQLTGTPRYFDPEHMTPLSLHQLVLFYEFHNKHRLGEHDTQCTHFHVMKTGYMMSKVK